jgi:hypothetical protein
VFPRYIAADLKCSVFLVSTVRLRIVLSLLGRSDLFVSGFLPYGICLGRARRLLDFTVCLSPSKMSKVEGDAINKLPAELWISVFQLTAPVFYEQDRSAKAHIRVHFRRYPLHRVRDSIPSVYKEKYAICKNVALTCSTFARLVTPVLYSHAFLRGGSAIVKFLKTIRINQTLGLYVKALVLLRDPSTASHQDTLVSMLPNLRVLHMASTPSEKQLKYPLSIEVLDLFLRYDSRAAAEAIRISSLRNLRILSLHSGDDSPTSFHAVCLPFPSLSALDITGVNNPALLGVFPTWRMPKLSVLCMSMPPHEHLLIDLLKAVSHTMLLLQLALKTSMMEASGAQVVLPRLKELTLVVRSMAAPPPATALRVFDSLPALQLLNIAQPNRPVSGTEHVALDATIKVVYCMIEGMNIFPKALGRIRVWESQPHEIKALGASIIAYGVVQGHEARFHRAGLQLMVMGPSGKYVSPGSAYRTVTRV